MVFIELLPLHHPLWKVLLVESTQLTVLLMKLFALRNNHGNNTTQQLHFSWISMANEAPEKKADIFFKVLF